MKTQKILIVFMVWVSFMWSGCGSDSSSSPVVQDSVERVKADLESKGFLVQEGDLFFFRLEDKWQMPLYYGNNPTSPYGFYRLPPGPGEPNTDVEIFPWDRDIDNFAKRSLWRLRPDEALVFIGKTPPECIYFGFRTYLFDRYLMVDGQPQLKDIFASLGDTANNLTMKTSSTYEYPGIDPYEKQTILISTADRGTEALVRKALIENGYPEKIINTGIIPGLDNEAHGFAPLLNMGYGEDADIFTMLIRVALFSDADAGQQYMSAQSARILRVTPMNAPPLETYTLPNLRESGTGTTEIPLEDSLLNLVEGVRKANQGPNRVIIETREGILPIQGPECIRGSHFCFGDNHDAQYIVYPIEKILATGEGFRIVKDNDDFILVVGVISSYTGKATYVNITPYYMVKQLGLVSMTGDMLIGSADRYIPDDPNRDFLYVAKIARNCAPNGVAEPHCVEVPTCTDDPMKVFPCAPLDVDLFIMNRVYLEPVTACQPTPDEILMPFFLHVRPLGS